MNKEYGFTLLELMVAMIIMLVLAGIGLPTMVHYYAKAKQDKAVAQMMRIEAALEQFNDDMGYYPTAATDGEYFGTTSTDEAKRIAIVEALSGYDKNKTKLTAYWDDPYWHGPYLEWTAKELDSAGQFIDPWRQPYLFDGTAAGRSIQNQGMIDVISRGPDQSWNPGNNNDPVNDDNLGNWLSGFVQDN